LATHGGDHAVNHPQRYLPRIFEQRRTRHGKAGSETVMAEVVAALLIFGSAAIFVAHAYDAYHAKPTARNIL
jgi:hypothetical protein